MQDPLMLQANLAKSLLSVLGRGKLAACPEADRIADLSFEFLPFLVPCCTCSVGAFYLTAEALASLPRKSALSIFSAIRVFPVLKDMKLVVQAAKSGLRYPDRSAQSCQSLETRLCHLDSPQ